MKTIRCGSGLGDSIYLHSVVRHLLRQGVALRVKSDYPEVFKDLPVEVIPFVRNAAITAHYASRKGIDGTTQFEDCCINAGITGPVEMKMEWTPGSEALIERLRAPGKPILVVQMPRAPMGRTDGFGAEIMPDCSVIQRHLDELKPTHTVVQIGAGAPLHHFTGIDIDLANQTTIRELIDVGYAADRFLGYCSFIVPLAESFGKPALIVWSRRGLNARSVYIRQITPRKILHAPTSRYVIDDQNPDVRFVSKAELRAVFAGKRVAIVGSGPGVLGNAPGFIDGHDVVVRVNNYKLRPQTGSRTDVFYSFFGRSIEKTAADLQHDGVTLCMNKCPDAKVMESAWHRRMNRPTGVDFRPLHADRSGFWFGDTYVPQVEDFMHKFNLLDGHVPTTGFAAVLDVLEHQPASVYMTGFDFFTSKVHNVDEPWAHKVTTDPIQHVPMVELAWIRANAASLPLQFDATLGALVHGPRVNDILRVAA